MIGKRLKELRTYEGLLQKELAEKLSLTQQTISLYESNDREPDSDTMLKIADFFNVSLDYLLSRTNIKNPSDTISSALDNDPELAAFWDELKEREDLQILLKQIRDISPKGIQQIIRIIKAIEDEEDREDG